jgi:Transglutaminase-like superfamily
VPLRDGADAMTVNWLMIEIRNPAGAVTYRNSFITDLPVGRDTVVELAACGRARWKIENESFNTLKTKGYNLEHNFGHGHQHLSAVLAILNLHGFSYVRRSVPGTQTPGETLRSRKGTCRDFALFMMEAARTMGFAARFVTGYIYVPDRDGPNRLGGGSTHAWCQIYQPGSGWVEFDPTNGIVGNRDLIRVAVARRPEQAIPLSGTYWGDRDDELAMEVAVNVKTESTTDADRK